MLDNAVACADPECVDADGRRNIAEPEQDGDHQYHECTVCGYAFGYQRLAPPIAVPRDGSCAIGVPADLRRAASAAMQDAITAGSPPLLTIGRRPDAHPAS